MVVNTDHGEYICKDITRKERRVLYKKVKSISQTSDVEKLHDLADEFAELAFGGEKEAEEGLKGLSAVQEDEVLNVIIATYMGFDLGNVIGD
tara:strand:- start:2263 stop:2538 length:276 start_codon:yes stop_codon:yes gene_type:complete